MSRTTGHYILVLLAGILVGVILAKTVSHAHAASENPLSIIESTSDGLTSIDKIYDSHNGAVCYLATSYSYQGVSISCIK